MKLIGRDFDARDLLDKVAERLGVPSRTSAQGRNESGPSRAPPDGADAPSTPDAAPDPQRFYVEALDRHADPREGLPIETHRVGLGRAVVLAKRAFRLGGRPFINELFERQRVFNGHVRDAVALLFAEVRALQEDVGRLRDAIDRSASPPGPNPVGPSRGPRHK